MKDTSWLGRTELLIGKNGIDILGNAHVLVVGLGGVGSFAAEFICRSGIGKMTIVDGDTVDISNKNRQLPALNSTIGLAKAEVVGARLLDINPELDLTIITSFITPEKVEEILSVEYDYIVDAIDSLTPKLTFINAAFFKKARFISSMGAGGKTDPTQVRVADISKTFNDPLAFQVRKRLRKVNIHKGFKAVFSEELYNPESLMLTNGANFKKSAYGTMSYLPAAFGGTLASVVIRDLLGMKIK